ncbi:MAG: twin-arginine translocase TatA/TatE family subunit [Chloroflexota bacterium]|nr:twin-arginine translocase TatA/TatE family subunit [Chloroflexota bacterium]
MEIFGFSAAKIIVILIIAIVILGPDKVPEMARTVGKTIRNVRRYINDMTKEFDAATGGLREEFTAITRDLKGELAATQADLRNQLDLTGIFAEAGATVAASPPSPSTVATAEPVTPTRADDSGETSQAAPPGDAFLVIPATGEADGPMRRATKTDPLADLAVATAPVSGTGVISHRNGRGATDRARAIEMGKVARSDVAPRHVIGRSVAASACLHRKGGIPGPCRGLCRSARPRRDTIVRGCAASQAATLALVGAL